jgi:hypothetical protein
MTVAWSFGGTALSTYGVVTLIGDYFDLPERRGENQLIPYRHGRTHVEKFYDQRKITVGIAVVENSQAAQEQMFDTMHQSFSLRTQQVLSYTLADASVRQALATIDTPMQVEWINDTFARVVLEFTLTEPFFRSDTITDPSETIDESPKAMQVTNDGTVEERNPTIILTGPLENVAITNTENGCILIYTGEIDDGDTVTIQQASSGEYTAVHSVDGNVIGNITHEGSTALMVLIPGDNDLSIESDVETTGTVQITFYPPYI